MENVILIPVDFNVECLNTLKLALRRNEERSNTIVLMYPYQGTTSITELMFNAPYKTLKTLRTKEFDDALAIIKNRFAKSIKRIKMELFTGHTKSAFEAFLEGNNVNEIYIPKTYKLKPVKGFNPIPIIKKSKLPIYEMAWDSNIIIYPLDQLGPLFSN